MEERRFFNAMWTKINDDNKVNVWCDLTGIDRTIFIMRIPNAPFKTRLYCIGDSERPVYIGVTNDDPWSEFNTPNKISFWNGMMVGSCDGIWDEEVDKSIFTLHSFVWTQLTDRYRRKLTREENECIYTFLTCIRRTYEGTWSNEDIIKCVKEKFEK